jgi:formate dehydrogenase subunit delta
MDIDHLVKMANQIGAFFESMPDRQQALADTVAHLRKSWDPRMRRQLLQYLDNKREEQREEQGGGQSGGHLSGFVLEALQAHRATLA